MRGFFFLCFVGSWLIFEWWLQFPRLDHVIRAEKSRYLAGADILGEGTVTINHRDCGICSAMRETRYHQATIRASHGDNFKALGASSAAIPSLIRLGRLVLFGFSHS